MTPAHIAQWYSTIGEGGMGSHSATLREQRNTTVQCTAVSTKVNDPMHNRKQRGVDSIFPLLFVLVFFLQAQFQDSNSPLRGTNTPSEILATKLMYPACTMRHSTYLIRYQKQLLPPCYPPCYFSLTFRLYPPKVRGHGGKRWRSCSTRSF